MVNLKSEGSPAHIYRQKSLLLHELIEAQAADRPDAMAVCFDEQILSYRELNERANQLAHWLRHRGIGPERRVGICLERSLDLPICLLAVLKTGGAYVPLDPELPQERLLYLVQDAQIALLLTQEDQSARFGAWERPALCVETFWEQSGEESKSNLAVRMSPENLAYIIYTSGSTGLPKGVCCEHRGVVNLLEAFQRKQPLSPMDRCSLWTRASFDASVYELFSSLCAGTILCLVPGTIMADSKQVVQWLERFQITSAFVPLFALGDLLSYLKEGKASLPLRRVMVGAEPVQEQLLVEISQCIKGLLIINAYGPTEASVCATLYDVPSASAQNRRAPIGYPVQNTSIYLLDAHLQQVSDSTPGEIYIGGEGLARCYCEQAELTAERFIPHPFSQEPGQRLYKTGDLARYLTDGTIEFIARIDHQVKLRGFRIELGEIEATLQRHPAIQEVVVVLREDRPGDRRLVAYVVAAEGQKPPAGQIYTYLREYLPIYMLPSSFVWLNAFPLTVNNKIDRRALPLPDVSHDTSEENDPSNISPLEEIISSIWSHILGRERIGQQENFLELGGHSLLATQIVSRIRTVLGINIPLLALFEQPIFSQFVQYVETTGWNRMEEQLPPLLSAPRNMATPLPLSYAQQRLWFLDQLVPNNIFYTVSMNWQLRGVLEVRALIWSLNALVERHESLRTRISMRGDQPVQYIAEQLDMPVPVIDLSGLSEMKRTLQAHKLSQEQRQFPFDLIHGPLLRARLLRLSEDDHWLVLTLHHIVTDGWSMDIFWRELAMGYQAALHREEVSLPALPIQYADYAIWQRQWLQGNILTRQLAYWQQQLTGAPDLLKLPADHPRPPLQSYRGAAYSFALSPALTRSLHILSQREGVTLFMTLLAAFSIVLKRYSGQDDLIIGTPVANRTREEVERVIGFFVNTLPLRVNLAEHLSFHDLLQQVREVALGAYMHQDVPFELLVETLQPERSLSYAPLCQVLFSLENWPQVPPALPGLQLQALAEESDTAKFDLSLELISVADRLEGKLEYSRDLFEPETIQRLAEHYQALLNEVVTHPEQKMTHLSLLSPSERMLLEEWNATQRGFPDEECVHKMFEAQVERTPEAIALVCGEEQITYGEVNRRANQLAHALLQSGVMRESLVGVCLERSPALIVSLLAILKTGAAYVPLDPAYPGERLAYMIQDALPGKIITTSVSNSKGDWPEGLAALQFCLDRSLEFALLAHQPVGKLQSHSLPANLAYVIYTSGSTGRPKGVQITHHGLSNLIYWHRETFAVTTRDRATQLASLSFDAAGWEIWPYLTAGATVCFVPDDVRISPAQLSGWLMEQSITVSFLPTPLLEHLLGEKDIQVPAGLRLLLTGGDQLHRLPRQDISCILVNNYGPTENTVVTTSGIVTTGTDSMENPTIGLPISNTRVYVLDRFMQPVPVGVTGELYIAGEGLGRGYLRRPDLTAEHFVPDPLSNQGGSRLYKTGDLVRYRADGTLDFVGRNDNQVKVRGVRIETGEIETVLGHHPGIKGAAVMVRKDNTGEKHLVACIVPDAQTSLTSSQVRAYLREKLPAVMVPSVLALLEHFPISPNGKLDRHALLALLDKRSLREEDYVSPRTDLEEVLVDIWKELLGGEAIGVTDNFFASGGHSLLATQVIARIKGTFQVDLPVSVMFEKPTVEELAVALLDREKKPGQFQKIAQLIKKIASLSDDNARKMLESRKQTKGI